MNEQNTETSETRNAPENTNVKRWQIIALVALGLTLDP